MADFIVKEIFIEKDSYYYYEFIEIYNKMI